MDGVSTKSRQGQVASRNETRGEIPLCGLQMEHGPG